MANINDPGFLKAANAAASNLTSYTASAAIAKDDIVAIASGKVAVFVPGTDTEVLGVAAHAAAVDGDAILVADDPAAEWVMQCSGTYTATTHDGTRVDLEGGTGAAEVNENAATDGTAFIIGAAPQPGSDEAGANARVRVKFVQHAKAGAPANDPGMSSFDSVATGTVFDSNANTVFAEASASAASYLDLFEDTDNGTNRVRIQAPAAVTSDRAITVPDADVTLADIATNKTHVDGDGSDHADVATNTSAVSTLMNAGSGYAHVADAAAATATAITDANGTADGTMAAIGDTSTGDRSADIMNNFRECSDEIAALITDVASLRTQFNALLTRLEAATGAGILADA